MTVAFEDIFPGALAAALPAVALPSPDWTAQPADGDKAPAIGGRIHQRLKRSVGVRPLAYFADKAGVASNPAVLADVADDDALYGATQLVLSAVAGTSHAFAPAAALAAPGVAVAGGLIRIWYKPLANIANLDGFWIELHSAGTPTAISANYHRSISQFGNGPQLIRFTSTQGASPGRWQSATIPVAQFEAIGTGADLGAILFARLGIRGKAGLPALQMALGAIEFVPNALTKAKCVLCFDDAYASHYTYAAKQMARYGFRGVLYPSAGARETMPIGGDPAVFMSVRQIKNLHDLHGWQIASQAWNTEDGAAVNAMSEDQLTAWFAKLRNWQNSLGLTGGGHGSYFNTTGFDNLQAFRSMRKHFRSMRGYVNGTTSVGSPPAPFGETFPFGDPMAIRCLNGNSPGWNANTAAFLQAHVDQAIVNKGVAMIAWHEGLELASTQQTGFVSLLAYLDANRGGIDVCTEEDLAAG